MLSLAILQEKTAGATSAPTTAGNWLPSVVVIGILLVVIAILVVAVVAILWRSEWESIPGGKTAIWFSAIVIVILAVMTLIYLVPGVASVLASVLGSVGPTVAALITALLAFLGVVLAQIVTVLVFGIGRLLDLRSNQERDKEVQDRETIRAQEEILRETIRAQEDILDRSLDRITDLLSGVPLREPNLEDVDRRAAARAWVLTALARLERDHKKILLQILHAANLTKKGGTDGHEQPIITLRGADLSGANLDDAELSGDSLNGAKLSGATLRNAALREADLSGADLSDADLSDANLRDAKGVTNEQLSAASSLEGATMPDGQTLKSTTNPDGPIFEDWLKSQGRKEDGENE
jgi:uncharacterized protein YjbI with pentapeptide repeats